MDYPTQKYDPISYPKTNFSFIIKTMIDFYTNNNNNLD